MAFTNISRSGIHARQPEVIARIRSAADRLGVWPYTGHVGRAPGTYEWVVVGLPYIIVYEVDEDADEVAIIAVFHGAQDR
ncbi:MAG TPA: type II toxin-antitoxin system RelE/ParE family toxin [Xanthobacteraceae bacterium]|jgi:toxin ParE1/3/4